MRVACLIVTLEIAGYQSAAGAADPAQQELEGAVADGLADSDVAADAAADAAADVAAVAPPPIRPSGGRQGHSRPGVASTRAPLCTRAGGPGGPGGPGGGGFGRRDPRARRHGGGGPILRSIARRLATIAVVTGDFGPHSPGAALMVVEAVPRPGGGVFLFDSGEIERDCSGCSGDDPGTTTPLLHEEGAAALSKRFEIDVFASPPPAVRFEEFAALGTLLLEPPAIPKDDLQIPALDDHFVLPPPAVALEYSRPILAKSWGGG